MTATIRLSREVNGKEVSHEATFDGDEWDSGDKYTAEFLNAFSEGWLLQGYYPDPTVGLTLEVAAALKDSLKAEFVSAEPLAEEETPVDATY